MSMLSCTFLYTLVTQIYMHLISYYNIPSLVFKCSNIFTINITINMVVWFILLGVCRWNCEIPWFHQGVPCLSTLELCSRQGARQIHVYPYLLQSHNTTQQDVYSVLWRIKSFETHRHCPIRQGKISTVL